MRSYWADLCAAVCALWLVTAGELAVVVGLNWTNVAGIWELGWGAAFLAPGALALGGLTAAVVHSVWRALLFDKPWVRALGLTSIGLVCVAIGYGLTPGRHFELWWRRAGVVTLMTVVGVAIAYRIAAAYRTTEKSGPARTRATHRAGAPALRRFGAALLLLVAAECANRFALVRLYPAFHWALSLLAVAVCVVGLSGVVRKSLSRAGAIAVGVVFVGAAALASPASERLARFDNFRWLLLEQAPLLGQVTGALALLSPPPALPAQDLGPPPPSRGGVSFSGRDILLVSVDAMRADHLGTYGYGRKTSPRIDGLARDGVAFAYAYCATPHTSYSVTSMMTGKYIRPLLLQGAGADSETWAQALRRYEYRTAAFYPPAVFFIDSARFQPFEQAQLGFEYQKKEFLEGEPRVQQVADYLDAQPEDQKLFIWVHLFGPHEPYEQDPRWNFGPTDKDRYDSEIAAADHVVGRLADEFRQKRPGGVVIITSDHGEEFGEHGGRYHGSSVYEEQVRVPLIVNAPGLVPPGRVDIPVQTIDLLPTVLGALSVPAQPRIRGRDLGSLLSGRLEKADLGFAYAETEEQSMLAEGPWRLICARRLGACRLFNLIKDPAQKIDLAGPEGKRFTRLKERVRQLNASHGTFEERGIRSEGKGWPGAILRATAGDGDAVVELGALLDDADVEVRRRAAKLLFDLPREEVAPALRLALSRDEDEDVRRYCALALTRQGEGASLTTELLTSPDQNFRRLAALALAEQGDRRGHLELVAWWQNREPEMEFGLATQIVAALGKARSKEAVWPLLASLDDVRLRPAIARALADIGDDVARGRLAKALAYEPYHGTRTVLADALNRLGAGTELVLPLRKWLGVPDPLTDGLRVATEAGILEHVGGPSESDLKRARENAAFGEVVRVIVPKGGNDGGLRLIARAKNTTSEKRVLRIGLPHGVFAYNSKGELTKSRKVPEIHPSLRVSLSYPPASKSSELRVLVPKEFGMAPGRSSHLVVLAERGLEFESLAVVPLQNEPVGPEPETPVSHRKKPTPAPSLDATTTPKQ